MYKIDLHILTSDIQTGKHINQLGSFEKEGKALLYNFNSSCKTQRHLLWGRGWHKGSSSMILSNPVAGLGRIYL